MTISSVFGLFSGIALFFFGMNLMGEGLKRVAGVTAVIRSSSATSVMLLGFAVLMFGISATAST